MSFSRDPYEVVLDDLRAKRDEIDRAIQAIQAVRPRLPAQESAPEPSKLPQAHPQPGSLFGLSIEEGSRIALKAHGSIMGPNDLVTALKDGGLVMNSVEPANTVSSVLNRGWRNGSDVVRVSRGMWGLAEWYPDRDMRYVPSSKDETEPEDGKSAQLAESDPLFG